MLFVLFSLTDGCRLLPVEALHSVQPLACYILLVHYSPTFLNPRCCLRHILCLSDTANSAPTRTIGGSALLGFLRTPNSAGRRTVQVRIDIVRMPAIVGVTAIVRVESPGTYPYYRGTPTVVGVSCIESTTDKKVDNFALHIVLLYMLCALGDVDKWEASIKA